MIPEELKQLKIYCTRNGITMQDFIDNAVKYAVKNNILK